MTITQNFSKSFTCVSDFISELANATAPRIIKFEEGITNTLPFGVLNCLLFSVFLDFILLNIETPIQTYRLVSFSFFVFPDFGIWILQDIQYCPSIDSE